mgnify:CR=1 FL=1
MSSEECDYRINYSKKEEEYMKRKQVIAFVSAAALAVTSLAGCGKTEEKTEKTTVSEAEETAKEDLPLIKISGNSNCPSWRLYESKCEA